MKQAILAILILSGALSGCSDDQSQLQVAASEPGQHWVTSDTLNRRTCPSESCGIVGKLFFRESAIVLEEDNGWARVSRYYDASCQSGLSQYVDSGNAACSEANGISGGQFAEWVSAQYLATVRPADPSDGATGLSRVVGGSDDFRRYEAAYVRAAESLIGSGQCTEKDFFDMGGWVKSSNQANRPIYFTYCKDGTDRIYLNAKTGEIFR